MPDREDEDKSDLEQGGAAGPAQRLRRAIISETALAESQRQRLLAALSEAMSPAFSSGAAATEWNDLALMVLRQKSSPFEKVERIAWIIDRWHREEER